MTARHWSAAGVAPEAALGFSLLIFAVFCVGSGALGLVMWWLKPTSWLRWRAGVRNGLHAGEGRA